MPTTAGPLDLISMIIDRWISLWTNIASSTFRVTTNNWVSSESGSRLVTRQMPDAWTSRICLLFWKKLTMIPIVCILCSCFEKSWRRHPLQLLQLFWHLISAHLYKKVAGSLFIKNRKEETYNHVDKKRKTQLQMLWSLIAL